MVTVQNVHKLNLRQQKTSTNSNVDKPKRRQTKTSTNRSAKLSSYVLVQWAVAELLGSRTSRLEAPRTAQHIGFDV